MLDTRQIIDYAADDNAKDMRESLYASIYDRVTSAIEMKRQEVGASMFNLPLSTEETEFEGFNLEDYSIEDLEEFVMSEDFEQLDELSKSTLKSYVKKAGAEKKNLIGKVVGGSGELSRNNPRDPEGTKARLDTNKSKLIKKTVGLGMATSKLKNKPMFGEENDSEHEDEKQDKEMCKDVAKKEVKGHEKRMHGKNEGY
jgi:hypothetical protein